MGQSSGPRISQTKVGGTQRKALKGSRLVGQLKRTASIQIALRLPEPDIEKAREIATRKGIGYQTLLKMLVHEGLPARRGVRDRFSTVTPSSNRKRIAVRNQDQNRCSRPRAGEDLASVSWN